MMKRSRCIATMLLGGLLCLGQSGCHFFQPPEPRADLESAAEAGSVDDFLALAQNSAHAELTTLEAINLLLRPQDRIYRPKGDGPFPAMLFFHGCSGPTLTHEEDWAHFFNGLGVALIAVDSYSGRGVSWQDACNLTAMTPWERASDVLATVAHMKTLDFIDAERLGLMGFSHGAGTIWTTLVFASQQTPPINLADWPESGLEGVKLALLFYGGCHDRWDVEIPTFSFLAGEDRYIDEQSCVDYVAANPDVSDYFHHRVFPKATHTFDHARPNLANVEAGSVFDSQATAESQRDIAAAIEKLMMNSTD